MDFLLWAVIAFVMAPIVIGPFVVKFTHWVTARVNVKLVSSESLDPEVRTFIDTARTEFEALGFEFVGYMMLPDYVPGTSSYFGLFTNDQRKTSAMTAVIRHASGRTVRYYELTNKYANGRVININNSPMMGGYKNPDKSSYRYPKIQSIKHLYEINSWVIGHDRKATNPVGLVKGRELDMLTEALNNEIRLQSKYGYYFLDENKARYKLTWKGAFILTEKNAFPIKTILELLDLRSARRAIAGMPAVKLKDDANRSGMAMHRAK